MLSLDMSWPSIEIFKDFFISSIFSLAKAVRDRALWWPKSLPSYCFLRSGTLPHIVSLHPGVQMGTSDILLGVTLRWTSIPSSEEQQYSQSLHATETGLSCGSCVPPWLESVFSYHLFYIIIMFQTKVLKHFWWLLFYHKMTIKDLQSFQNPALNMVN